MVHYVFQAATFWMSWFEQILFQQKSCGHEVPISETFGLRFGKLQNSVVPIQHTIWGCIERPCCWGSMNQKAPQLIAISIARFPSVWFLPFFCWGMDAPHGYYAQISSFSVLRKKLCKSPIFMDVTRNNTNRKSRFFVLKVSPSPAFGPPKFGDQMMR